VDPDIDAAGVVRWRDDDGAAHEWGSLAELGVDWWRYQRLTAPERDTDPMIAWDCVERFVALDGYGAPHPRVVDVIQALVDAARDDDDLGMVGAGPLESLLSHSGHGAYFVDDVERRARQHPKFREAASGMWLSEDVPREVRERLATLGATDLGESPNP
jgi:hypothetical protein